MTGVQTCALPIFRPTLCYAPPYAQATEQKKGQKPHKIVSPGPLPSTCPSANLIVTSNLAPAGANSNNPYPNAIDQTLSAYPSTTPKGDAQRQHKTVLLPGPGASNGLRYLAGPAELTGHIVKSAIATLTTTQGWVVDVSLTGTGGKAWDALAQKYFHEVIAIELDGVVQSAPLTLPASSEERPRVGVTVWVVSCTRRIGSVP